MVGMDEWHAWLVYQYDRPDLCRRWKTARRSTAWAKRKSSKHTNKSVCCTMNINSPILFFIEQARHMASTTFFFSDPFTLTLLQMWPRHQPEYCIDLLFTCKRTSTASATSFLKKDFSSLRQLKEEKVNNVLRRNV